MINEMISPRTSQSVGGIGGAALVAGAVLVAGLAIAFVDRPPPPPPAFRPAGALNSLQTVSLVNGQVYFGKLTSVTNNALVLSDVYEAITTTNPQTQQQVTRLVSRQHSDWHGPLDMTIPDDKVLFVETVGPESSVGKAMASAARAAHDAQTQGTVAPPPAATGGTLQAPSELRAGDQAPAAGTPAGNAGSSQH